MKKLILILTIFSLTISCKNNLNTKADKIDQNHSQFSIVIHGGAGSILRKNMTSEQELLYKTKLEEAIRIGYNILKNGGSSLDAVQKQLIF